MAEEGEQGSEHKSIIMDAKYSDLTITLVESSASYKVHKIYIANASPVMEKLIDDLQPKCNELTLNEGPPEAFHWLLRFIYGADPPMECRKQAVSVSCMVGRYKVKTLYPVCIEWLDDILDRETLLEVFNAAYILRNSLLVTKCLQLLLTCADQVLSSQQVCCLSEEALKYLLKQPLSVKSEAVILNAVIVWGRAQPPQHHNICGPPLHYRIQGVLPCVRILTLTAEEIVQYVMSSGVYSPEECKAILMHKTQTIGALPLPETCSSLLTKRKCFDAFPLSRVLLPGARNAPFVPNTMTYNKERVLVSGLRVDSSVLVQRVEGRGVGLMKVTAAVRDTAGQTLYTSAMHEGVFEVPVVLDPSKVCTVTAKVRKNDWYDALHSFDAEAAGVHFTGEHTLLSEGCYLYFWRLDRFLCVDL